MMLLQTWLLKRDLSTLGMRCGNRLLLHYWVGTSSSRYDERNQLLADAASVVARRCVERACMRYNIGTRMDWHHVYVCQRRLNACNTEHKLVNSLFKSTVYSYSCTSRKTLKPQTPDLYGTKRVLEGFMGLGLFEFRVAPGLGVGGGLFLGKTTRGLDA